MKNTSEFSRGQCCFPVRAYSLKSCRRWRQIIQRAVTTHKFWELCQSPSALPQTRKASSCYYSFPGLPPCTHPRARTRFSGYHQLSPKYGTAAVLASGGFLLHKYENHWKLHSSDATEFWNPLEEKVFPLLPASQMAAWEVILLLPRAEPHSAWFCWVQMCNNKMCATGHTS